MAITKIAARQLQDTLDLTSKTVSVAAPTANAHAATKLYVDNKVSALGSVFEYVATVAGGVDSANATDLALQTQKSTGDYYKVSTSGYFKIDTGAAFYAKQNDGLVWNTASGIDVIDNTNSNVSGTANEISVTGSSDTGFTVALASAFTTRMTDAETAISNLTSGAFSMSASYKRETPSGSINGTNTDFTLSATPIAGTVEVFLNGLLQEVSDDYTISGTTVSFISAPVSGDKVKVKFFV